MTGWPGDRRRPAVWVEWAAAGGLAAVLVASAVGHLGNPYQHLSAVYAYGLLGPAAGTVAAGGLPFVQIALAVGLLAGGWRPAALVGGLLLFGGFAAAQASALARGLRIGCGCFGGDGEMVGAGSLLVTGGCAAAAAVALAARWSRRGAGFQLARPAVGQVGNLPHDKLVSGR